MKDDAVAYQKSILSELGCTVCNGNMFKSSVLRGYHENPGIELWYPPKCLICTRCGHITMFLDFEDISNERFAVTPEHEVIYKGERILEPEEEKRIKEYAQRRSEKL